MIVEALPGLILFQISFSVWAQQGKGYMFKDMDSSTGPTQRTMESCSLKLNSSLFGSSINALLQWYLGENLI